MYKVGDLVGPHKIKLLERLYKDKNKKWVCRFECPECGNDFITVLGNVGNGDTTSCGCIRKKAIQQLGKRSRSNLVGQHFGYLTVISDTGKTNNAGYAIFKCQCDCDNIIEVPSLLLKSGNKTSCGLCGHKSKGEMLIAQYLDLMDIKYIREYKIDNCKDKRALPFDFYLPDYNLCIEYNGIQHYQECGWGKDKLSYTQEHDKIKKEYCLNNNIQLLIISYLEQDNIEEILCQTLSL